MSLGSFKDLTRLQTSYITLGFRLLILPMIIIDILPSFTKAQLREGSRRCIDNVKGLLDSASLLLDNKNSQQYALGLYIYAVEEYGKAILLKKYITRNKDKYQIPGWIFGSGKLTIERIRDDSVLRKLLKQAGRKPRLEEVYSCP